MTKYFLDGMLPKLNREMKSESLEDRQRALNSLKVGVNSKSKIYTADGNSHKQMGQLQSQAYF